MKRKSLITWSSIDPDTGKRRETRWICKHCGLERSNKTTHKHEKNIGEKIWQK